LLIPLLRFYFDDDNIALRAIELSFTKFIRLVEHQHDNVVIVVVEDRSM
jgi:hypothetical protein